MKVLYDRYAPAATGKGIPSQKKPVPMTSSCPRQIHPPPELAPDLLILGYDRTFGKDSFIVQGTPADTGQGNEKAILETCWSNSSISAAT